MVYVTQIEKHKSSIRQANDFKRALRGRQPTSFIAFILFVLFCVILICFVGICPNMMRKSEFFLKPLTRNQTHHINYFFPSKKKKTFIFQKVGTVVPTYQPKKKFVFFSPSFKRTQPLSSFKPPYLSPFIIPNINHNQNQLSSIQTLNSYTIKP